MLRMTVADLIKALTPFPPDADVGLVWDGHIRSGTTAVYEARSGVVALLDSNGEVYVSREARNDDGPSDHPANPTFVISRGLAKLR
jgi:hypothetical protein